MNDNYVLGIDFGSDSVRCLVVDSSDGRIAGQAVELYPRWTAGLYCNPAESRYRQHPLDYLESLEKCVKAALANSSAAPSKIRGISFDATASTPVLVDKAGVPLSLSPEFSEDPDAMFILWKDHTAIEEADRINEAAHSWPEDYTRFSGGSFSCEWTWAKMLHVLKKSPHLRGKAYSWVEHCDWIAAVLTGDTTPEKMARSRCAAGHKALWNALWGGLPSWDFLTAVDPLLGIFKNHLFKNTVTADKRVGGLCREWVEKLGLPEGTAVGVGAIDCHIGAVGAGIAPGTLVKVMGTSTCDVAVAEYDDIGDRMVKGICGQVDGSVVPGYVGFEAGQASFGDVYAWFRRLLGWSLDLVPDGKEASASILKKLGEEASELPLTADDPVSLDWFNGRRSPDSDPRVKAAISGLTLATTAPQVYKSLVEATSFGSRAINERLISEGVRVERIVAVGGITKKSPFVMQTMADVLGMPIKVLECDQACALGAAMFASVVAGLYPDVKAAQRAMASGFSAEYVPDASRHSIYNALYARYLNLGAR